MKMHLLIALTLILSCTTPQSQYSNERLLTAQNSSVNEQSKRIKWTWQLPALVRSGFNKSNYANWYIEKMIRYKADGKTVYRFYINNTSLLDGDHYYSFLKEDSLDISDDGMVLKK